MNIVTKRIIWGNKQLTRKHTYDIMVHMKDIVKQEKGIILADSRDLEDVFGIAHRSIYRLISRYQEQLTIFGKVRFENAPTESGQTQSYVMLNENQALLLLTYTRSNEKTNEYRKKLIQQFSAMRDYIKLHDVARLLGIETRKTLTDIIQESGENERQHGHAYSNYTNLAYKLTGLEKGSRDSLNADDLDRLESVESIIRGLVKAGKQYSDIKDSLLPLFNGN